jgi:hypothetical protein
MRPKPITAPTMLCVVDTGHPAYVAMFSQSAAAIRQQVIPMAITMGSPPSASISTMPLRMVFVTVPPASMAPPNSKIAATIIAPRRVSAPEPTEVPMALATSLAPMFQAM